MNLFNSNPNRKSNRPNRINLVWFDTLFGLIWFEKYQTELIWFESNFHETDPNRTELHSYPTRLQLWRKHPKRNKISRLLETEDRLKKENSDYQLKRKQRKHFSSTSFIFQLQDFECLHKRIYKWYLLAFGFSFTSWHWFLCMFYKNQVAAEARLHNLSRIVC